MKIKRSLALVLSFLLLVGTLSACGEAAPTATAPGETPVNTEDVQNTEAAVPTQTPENPTQTPEATTTPDPNAPENALSGHYMQTKVTRTVHRISTEGIEYSDDPTVEEYRYTLNSRETYDATGKLLERFEFDKEGRWTKRAFYDSKNKAWLEANYDFDCLPVELFCKDFLLNGVLYKEGKAEKNYSTAEYDEQGRLIKYSCKPDFPNPENLGFLYDSTEKVLLNYDIQWLEDGGVQIERYYDPITEKYSFTSRFIWNYDADGKLVKKTEKSAATNIDQNEYEYEYDVDGVAVRITEYVTPTNEKRRICGVYEYDENGNMISSKNRPFLFEDKLEDSEQYEYEYDDRGNLIKVHVTYYYTTGASTTPYEAEYDEDGRLIREVHRGYEDFHCEYAYNERGDLIRKKVETYFKGELTGWTEYEYELTEATVAQWKFAQQTEERTGKLYEESLFRWVPGKI